MAANLLEQMISFQQENAASICSLSGQVFHGACELVELNMQTFRSTLEQAETELQNSFTLKSPEAFIIDRTNAVQPLTQKALAYGCRAFDIVTSIQSGFANAVNTDFVEKSERAGQMAGAWSETMPASIGFFNNTPNPVFSGVSDAFDAVRKAATQTIDLAQQGLVFNALVPVTE